MERCIGRQDTDGADQSVIILPYWLQAAIILHRVQHAVGCLQRTGLQVDIPRRRRPNFRIWTLAGTKKDRAAWMAQRFFF